RAPPARIWTPGDLRQAVSRRRLRRRPAGGLPGVVSESNRFDHPDPDVAVSRDHPVDAVLVWATVCGDRADDPRSDGGAHRCLSRLARGTPAGKKKGGKFLEGSGAGGEGWGGRRT